MNGHKTILVVDDNKVNIDIVLGLLDGYDLLVALDGQSTLDIASEEAIDLILLDIMMPGMDGFQTCRELKKNPETKDIPVIFITAKTDELSIEKAYEIGGEDYVTKPFKPRELMARIKTQLDHKELLQKFARSEKKYRSMLESMKDGVYICSQMFRIEYMNPTMIDLVGRDATGEICHKAIYGLEEKCSWCTFDKIKQKKHVDQEVTNPRDKRYYFITSSPISHTDGTVSKLTIYRDITELKELREIIPICASCKKVRDDEGLWDNVEAYINKYTDAQLSHGMCPECSDKLYGKEDWYIEMKNEEQQKE